MNKAELCGYLERIDRALAQPTSLMIYGSAACILLDEPERTSLDDDSVDMQLWGRVAG